MKKKSSKSKLFIFISVFLILILITGLWGYRWLVFQLSPAVRGPVSFEIPQNANLSSITKLIKDIGYVRNDRVFALYLRYKELDRDIKAGQYTIESYTSLEDLSSLLTRGQEKLFTFTIPEGYTIKQIARKLSTEGLVDEQAFLDLALHPPAELSRDLLAEFPENASLEGFLFPETYSLARPDAYRIIEMMTQQFKKVFTPELYSDTERLGLSPYELVVLASIIEKEAQSAEEFPQVASVFYNRLRDGWRLEACSTVEYVIDKESYVLSLEELEIDSPYNTYRVDGLPVGPIANPGARAISAALNPASTPYFFFVAKGDGTHAFSKSLEEHHRNVRKYLP
jgi:UPF0755 protein